MIVRSQAKENEIVQRIEELCDLIVKEKNPEISKRLLSQLEEALNKYVFYRQKFVWHDKTLVF